MLFNSFAFIAFFAAVFVLHWSLPPRARTPLLLIASVVFYGSWDWRFLGLIALSTGIDWVAGLRIAASGSEPVRRGWLLASLLANLTMLGFFKYYNFFVDGLDRLLGAFGGSAAALHLDLILPLGISFYTFQTMSYSIDVYRRQMEPVRNLAEFALFVCFFPQLVSGPIERATHLIPQIRGERRLTRIHLDEGLVLLVWGLFKKVVVADNLARVVDPVYAQGAHPGGLDVILATVAFTFLAYADFSAYTDIARGTARLLGFDLMRNFDVPFGSRDMGELWRRWHISLGSWLRDYLYVPLGGNRRGEARVCFNLWLTLFLAGLWHGSDATFVAFGAYHGTLVVLSRWYRRWRPLRPGRSHWPAVIVTFGLFTAGMVFFRAQSYAQCEALIGAVLGGLSWHPEVWSSLLLIGVCAAPLVVADVFQWRAGSDLYVLSWPLAARAVTYLGIFYAIVLFGRSDGYSFLYFQF